MNVIYMITNSINGKCYIGQTNDIKRRIRRHKNDSRSYDTYLYKSIRKYGWNNFTHSIIETCKNRNELNQKEVYYIRKYDTFIPNGYNMTLGGDGHKGLSPSLDTREKISEANKKIKKTEEWCRKISETKKRKYKKENHPNYGKHLSEETRKKISESHKGKHLKEETKKKISLYLRSENNKNRNTYVIISPDGCVTETSFLKEFCGKTNLTYSCMVKTGRGERTHHKGYKCKIK
jgi:group I intron endonuclease